MLFSLSLEPGRGTRAARGPQNRKTLARFQVELLYQTEGDALDRATLPCFGVTLNCAAEVKVGNGFLSDGRRISLTSRRSPNSLIAGVGIYSLDARNSSFVFSICYFEDLIMSASASEAGFPSLGENFEVLELVGMGGMGSVYKVRDLRQDRIVAVKILLAELADDTAALKRFEQEAEAASKLSHPNLVSTYEHGITPDGAPYLVMDYFEGESLSDCLKREGLFKPTRALTLIRQICEALAHAHAEGVVHRDIKPTNIIISRDESGSELARVVDFGIAKVMPKANRETHNLTETGEVFGSPHYMSPEQCLGFMLDSRSDIYSLGCLMYELLTGDPPFGGANPIQVVVKHINEEIAPFPASAKKDKLAKGLEAVVLRCLEKDQVNRYQSVEALIEDLKLLESGKQPTRYKRKVKQKREFTKRQMIGSMVGLAAIVFYAGVSSALFQQFYLLPVVLLLVLNFLVLGGIYICATSFFDNYQKFENWRNTGSGWWLMLVSLSFGIICLTILPFSLIGGTLAVSSPFLMLIPGVSSFKAPGWIASLAYIDLYIHMVAALSLVVSGVGLFFFRGKKRYGIWTVASQFVGVSAVLVIGVTLVFASQLSRTGFYLASASGEYLPAVTKTMAEAAFLLDKKNDDAARLAAEFERKEGSYNAAIDILDKAIAVSKNDKALLFDRAMVRIDAGDFAAAFKDADKLELLGEDDTNKQSHYLRGRALEAQGQFEAASDQYLQSVTNTWNDSHKYQAVRVLCRAGKYKEALKLADNASENKDSHCRGLTNLVAALCKEKLGDTDGAVEAFGRAEDSYSLSGSTFIEAEYLAFPYSMHYSKVKQEGDMCNLVKAYAASKGHRPKSEVDKHLKDAKPLTRADLSKHSIFQDTGFEVIW